MEYPLLSDDRGPISPPSQQPSRPPQMGLPSRGGQRRFTYLLVGALAALIAIQVLTSHPLPTPSHQTAAAAVAGYLEGIQHKDLAEVRRYLVRDQRPQADTVLRAFAKAHAYITATNVGYIDTEKRTARVTLDLEVCSPQGSRRIYSCTSVARSPLGLPTELSCDKVDGLWYVTTLFKPV